MRNAFVYQIELFEADGKYNKNESKITFARCGGLLGFGDFLLFQRYLL